MGSGIAVAFLRAGTRTSLCARRESSLEAARSRIAASLDVLVEARELTSVDARAALGRVVMTTSLEEAVLEADLVIETIPEELELKHEVLERAEAAMRPDAILATDTSSLRITELAEPLERPEAFAGFHWFNPPELVELVEVVAGERTAPETVRCLLGWALAIGKRAIVVERDVEGFVANRLQYALLREAYALVESGICDYAAVDEALKAGLGARWAALGPFESMDLAGLDVHLAVVRRLFPDLANSTEAPHVVRRLVEEGALGCKTGKGLYGDYEEGDVLGLVTRRARVLLTLARLRRGQGHEP